MQLIGHGEAARKFAVPTRGIWINAITNAALRGVILGALIHAALNSGVTVTINQTRRDMFSGAIYHKRVGGNILQVASNGLHFSIHHQQVRIFQSARGPTCPDGGVLHQHCLSDRRFLKTVFAQWHDRWNERQWVFGFLFCSYYGDIDFCICDFCIYDFCICDFRICDFYICDFCICNFRIRDWRNFTLCQHKCN